MFLPIIDRRSLALPILFVVHHTFVRRPFNDGHSVGRAALRIVCEKKLTFHDALTGFFGKWCLRNDWKNSILMTFTTQILVVLLIGWTKFRFRPVRSTFQILVVTRHQYGFSVVVAQTSFAGKPVMSAVLWGYGRKGSLGLLNETLILPYNEKHCIKSLKIPIWAFA